jgi:hypothetical protein
MVIVHRTPAGDVKHATFSPTFFPLLIFAKLFFPPFWFAKINVSRRSSGGRYLASAWKR